jgi:hypothetical protein
VRDSAAFDLEAASRSTAPSMAHSCLPPAPLERLEHRGVDLAPAETADPHQGVPAVPRLADPANLDFVTFETGRDHHDGGAYVATQFQDDCTGPARRDGCFHGRQDATDAGVTEGFE